MFDRIFFVLFSGEIPLGYRFRAQQECDEVHKIPLDFEDASNDYPLIWAQIEQFVNPEGKKDFPPVFVLENNLAAFEGGLAWLHIHAEVQVSNRMRVFVLENLVREMYSQAGKSITTAAAYNVLSASTWDYISNTRYVML